MYMYICIRFRKYKKENTKFFAFFRPIITGRARLFLVYIYAKHDASVSKILEHAYRDADAGRNTFRR